MKFLSLAEYEEKFANTPYKKIERGLYKFTSLAISFLVILFVFRIFEFGLLAFNNKLPKGAFGLFFRGISVDIKVWLLICGYLMIPYLLVRLLADRFANILFYTVVGILLIIYLNLIFYFSETLSPLSSDVYGYSWADIKTTIKASGSLNVKSIFFLLIILLIIGFGAYWLQKINYRKPIVIAFSILCLGSLFFLSISGLSPHEGKFRNEIDYYIASNKLGYFASRSYIYFSDAGITSQKSNSQQISVEEGDNNFEYVDNEFPFLRKEILSDVLGAFFKPDSIKPDFVFIVIEGLGRSFSGPNAFHGSFTPFLDSLSQKSLYWENFNSTSGRTFAILPSMFGSLPFCKSGFNEVAKMPDHFSLLNIFKKNGYHTAFYYGGEAQFDNMDAFLEKGNIDAVIDDDRFEKTYNKLPAKANGFSWGYGDFELYDKGIKTIATAASPAVHTILTISTHDPFLIPNQAMYEKLARERIGTLGKEKDMHLTYLKQYSTILYADDALRKFFTDYASLTKFKNTVFIITGDHQLPEIPIGTKIERFHVPLIIFSPLLQRTASFKGVCSQFDIAPTILHFMNNNFQLPLPALNHWIGSSLDTSRTFRSIKRFPLMRNKNELLDYVSNDFFYSDGQLFKISSNMDIEKIDDDEKLQEVRSQFQDFKNKNAAACDKPSLIPDSLKKYK